MTWEWYRCCLLRTLLSYNGRTTAEGGADLQPDIASALPEISSDGLTYTFTLKSGISYGDPFGDVEVTSGDIVRALERESDPDASVGGYNFYYNIIDGFAEFGEGKADSIGPRDARRQHPRGDAHASPPATCRTCSRWRQRLRSHRRRRAARCGDGAHEGLRPVPGGERAVPVRRGREPGLLAAGRRADAGRRLRARQVDPAGSQPELRPSHGRPASRLPGWVQHHDRWGQQRPVQQGPGRRARRRRGRHRATTGPAHVLDRPDAAAEAAHQPIGRRSIHLVQHGGAAVRRHPRPEGGQPRVGQGRDADVPWR